MSERKIDQLEIWSVSAITPYAENVKDHPIEQIEKLANSIREFGWTSPIVVDKEGVIISGHGRLMAAKYLGLEKVPVLIRRDLTKKQAMALRLADNQISTLGNIDMDALSREIASMMSIDDGMIIDIGDLGFDAGLFTLEAMEDTFLATPATTSPTSEEAAPQNQQETDHSKPNLANEQQYRELRQVICDCADEADQQRVYEMLTNAGYVCRPLTL